ncbi:MAG: response regulator transcription factor [Limnohabitans sp.]
MQAPLTHTPLTYRSSSLLGHVYIVEDDAAVRDSLQRTVLSQGHRVYAYAEPHAFLDDIQRVFPMVVLLDMRLPSATGVEVQSRLRQRGMDMPVIFVSGESTVQQAVVAMQNGAAQFLVKPVGRDELLEAVRRGLASDAALQDERIRQDLRLGRLSRLAPREREVLALLVEGRGNQEISARLEISYATAKQYKSNVMIKLGVHSMAELLEFMRRS